MKAPCPDCGRIHAATDTQAQRRFEPTLTHTYRAAYPHALERATRAEAERDMCQHRQEHDR